jgi:hypothetical protein
MLFFTLPSILDGHGFQILTCEGGNHIRQEKRNEMHKHFLELKATGVEYLKSVQCTAYVSVGAGRPGPGWFPCGIILPFESKQYIPAVSLCQRSHVAASHYCICNQFER